MPSHRLVERRPDADQGTVGPAAAGERMNHYTLLRTIEKAYGLPPLGRAHAARPLSKISKK